MLVLPRSGGSRRTSPGTSTERAAGRDWRVTGTGFWQVHPGRRTPWSTLSWLLDARPGESALDLYSGVGLFAGAARRRSVRSARSWRWSHRPARSRDARRNLRDLPQVRVVHARVDRGCPPPPRRRRTDLVVLDPPRSGAGRRGRRRGRRLAPGSIAYVACDPAALARDIAYLRAAGYEAGVSCAPSTCSR